MSFLISYISAFGWFDGYRVSGLTLSRAFFIDRNVEALAATSSILSEG